MNRRIIVAFVLPLLLLAAAGCKVNEHIQQALTYQWDGVVRPEFEAYVKADASLTDEQRAEYLVEAQTLSDVIAAPVHGWNVNQKYLHAVYDARNPLMLYMEYVAASDLRPDSKIIRLRSAQQIIDKLILLTK